MIRARKFYLLPVGIALLFLKCESLQQNTPENNNNTGNTAIEALVTYASDCKQFKIAESLSELTDTVSCIEYSFDADSNILLLKHLNAGFNCCPESLFCSVVSRGDSIIIQEFEAAALCRCNCLYDLEIRIEGVESKSYQLRIIEPYAMEMEQLVFEIDLTENTTGSYCVTRKIYPWGIFYGQEEPAEILGELVNHTDCKGYSSAVQTSMDISSGESCVEYNFDSETGNLSMKHINATFNCCPENIDCTISTESDTIYIRETEIDGLCDCLCLFDLDIQLEGLLPTRYYVIFQEQYLDKDEKLEFVIDLQYHPIGSYCVSREEYPWGI
jgi:hypothetical protein